MTYVHGASETQKLRAEVARLRAANHELSKRADPKALVDQMTPIIGEKFQQLHQVRGKRIKSARRRKQINMAHTAALREEDARKGAYRMRIILEEIDAYNQGKKVS